MTQQSVPFLDLKIWRLCFSSEISDRLFIGGVLPCSVTGGFGMDTELLVRDFPLSHMLVAYTTAPKPALFSFLHSYVRLDTAGIFR
jgi:hypothetical protein